MDKSTAHLSTFACVGRAQLLHLHAKSHSKCRNKTKKWHTLQQRLGEQEKMLRKGTDKKKRGASKANGFREPHIWVRQNKQEIYRKKEKEGPPTTCTGSAAVSWARPKICNGKRGLVELWEPSLAASIGCSDDGGQKVGFTKRCFEIRGAVNCTSKRNRKICIYS